MRPTEQTGRPPDRAAGAVATIDKYQHGSCRAAARARRGRRPGHAVDTSIWTLPKRAACTRTGTSAGTHGVGGGSALTKSTKTPTSPNPSMPTSAGTGPTQSSPRSTRHDTCIGLASRSVRNVLTIFSDKSSAFLGTLKTTCSGSSGARSRSSAPTSLAFT